MRDFLKYLSAVLLSLTVILFCGSSVSAQFDDTVIKNGSYTEKEIKLMHFLDDILSRHADREICLDNYGVTEARFEQLYSTVFFNRPEYHYVSATKGFFYERMGRNYFRPLYTFSSSQAERRDELIEKEVDKLLDSITPDMSDVDKLLYFHDDLVARCDYYSGGLDDVDETGRNIYDTFVEGKAVCVGYSLAFEYLCDRVGIPCVTVTSEDHIWNMVQLDKKWYYVDCTWDEFFDNQAGFVAHTLFLQSQKAFDNYSVSHGEYSVKYKADSTKYDKYFWQDTYCKMAYRSGAWYYIKKNGLYKWNEKTNKERQVYWVSEMWTYDRDKEWTISFGKVAAAGNSVLFTSQHELYSLDKDGSVRKLFTVDKKNGEIYDLIIDRAEGKARLYVTRDPFSDATTVYSLKLGGILPEEEKTGKTGKLRLNIIATDSKITLKWEEIPEAKQYIIYRIDPSTGKRKKIGTSAGNTYIFKRTAKDHECSYAVRVKTSEGLSQFSNEVYLK